MPLSPWISKIHTSSYLVLVLMPPKISSLLLDMATAVWCDLGKGISSPSALVVFDSFQTKRSGLWMSKFHTSLKVDATPE